MNCTCGGIHFLVYTSLSERCLKCIVCLSEVYQMTFFFNLAVRVPRWRKINRGGRPADAQSPGILIPTMEGQRVKLTLPGSDFVVPEKQRNCNSMLQTTEAFCPRHTMLDMLTYPSNSKLHQAIIKKYLLGEEIFTSSWNVFLCCFLIPVSVRILMKKLFRAVHARFRFE